MIDADEQLAARLQAEEHKQFYIEEKSRMLVEMIAERKKFFAAQRAAEQRSKPPTKNQIRNRMCTYLKNMGGYKHNHLKGRSYKEFQKLFDKAYKQLESDKSKKQKIVEHVEAEKDDQEGEEMKRHIEIVKDNEVGIDAIPLATKPPVIVDNKIDKDGRMGYFKSIRADGSSKRPKEDYKRVLWGDLKVMFEPDIKSEVWRNLQGYKVTIWKLFDNCGENEVEEEGSVEPSKTNYTYHKNANETDEEVESEKEVDEETEGETEEEEEDNPEHFGTFPTIKELRKPFVEATGLVYNKEEGTIVFERDKERIIFKIPHKMDMFKHIDFKDRGTDSIPPFVIESDDDNCEKTHYSDSLDERSNMEEFIRKESIALEAIRFMWSTLCEGRIVGIKSLLEVTAVKVLVTAAKHKLVLLVILMKNMLSINVAGTKVTTAERLQLLKG
ncbi:hypothetical protein Tco_0144673 [Tanacetum coccineum]